jgi:urease accessory protein
MVVSGGAPATNMVIVERTYTDADLPAEARSYARDTLTLGWEDRTRAHARRRSDGGVEFATSLPRGTMLRAGDCFVLHASELVVTVVEQPEAVFVIQPRAPAEWALYAYHIGNRHQPLMITGDALVCPDVPGVEQLLEHHGMPYVRQRQAFTPAALVASHSH